MNNFVKVVEIWQPTEDKQSLVLADACYGEYAEFQHDSRDRLFHYDEGLPGKAWSEAKPIIITLTGDSCFARKQAAVDAKLSCAIAIPIFAGEFLNSVVVMLCGERGANEGVVELWTQAKKSVPQLSLSNGYYGKHDRLEKASRIMQFGPGIGLPGMVWDYQIPMLVTDISNSSVFKRASMASLSGIEYALGIPFKFYNDKEYTLTFLSSQMAPLAQRIEVWLPDREHQKLILHTGIYREDIQQVEHSQQMAAAGGHRKLSPAISDMHSYSHVIRQIETSATSAERVYVEKGGSFLGKVWLSGCPAISHAPDHKPATSDNHKYHCALALPFVEGGFLRSVITLYL